jgi:flagellin
MAGITLHANFAESIAMRSMATNQKRMSVSLERLSTGKKINRASDDPSGMVSSEALKLEQKSVLAKIQLNVREGHRYAAIDGGLSGVQDLLLNLKNNVVQAANTGGLSQAEREALQTETNGIIDGLDHLAGFTFNGDQVLAPYLGATARVTTAGTDALPPTTTNVSIGLQSLRSGGSLNLVNGNLEGADQFVEALSKSIVDGRATVGAVQKGLDHENAALATRNENLSAAISQIVDTDYASEVGSLVRSQVLAEASKYAVQAARDIQAQTVLALIKGEAMAGTKSGDKTP